MARDNRSDAPGTADQAATEQQRAEPSAAGAIAGLDSAAAPDPGPVDRDVLASLRRVYDRDGQRNLSSVVTMFLTDAEQTCHELRHAVEQDEPGQLRTLAHRLKATSAMLGATRLYQLYAWLERLGREGSTEGASQRVDQLERELEAVRRFFEAEEG